VVIAMRAVGPAKRQKAEADAFAIKVCWSLRADIFPAAEDALLPIAGRPGGRTPSDRIGRHADNIVSHPNALIGSTEPISLRRLTDEEKRGGNE
jgi:hypothetical protein